MRVSVLRPEASAYGSRFRTEPNRYNQNVPKTGIPTRPNLTRFQAGERVWSREGKKKGVVSCQFSVVSGQKELQGMLRVPKGLALCSPTRERRDVLTSQDYDLISPSRSPVRPWRSICSLTNDLAAKKWHRLPACDCCNTGWKPMPHFKRES